MDSEYGEIKSKYFKSTKNHLMDIGTKTDSENQFLPEKSHETDGDKCTKQESETPSSSTDAESLFYDIQDSSALESQSQPAYTDGDFLSAEDSDTDKDIEPEQEVMGAKQSKSRLKDISYRSSDEDDGFTWHSPETERKKPKFHQTTLNFGPERKNQQTNRYSMLKRFSDKDTEMYRNGYPGKKDCLKQRLNLLFYQNKIQSTPDGDFIDQIHKRWQGNYALLEGHHGYIQWLFPIREDGMNWQAQALQKHEAESIQEDPEAKERVLRSYELMLDFYGMKLLDRDSGEIHRSENWRARFNNLSWSSHNYLRITRILKSLGELGWEHLKKPFLKFVLYEALNTKKLERTLRSCRDYWIGTVKNDQDRMELYEVIDSHSWQA